MNSRPLFKALWNLIFFSRAVSTETYSFDRYMDSLFFCKASAHKMVSPLFLFARSFLLSVAQVSTQYHDTVKVAALRGR
jgi:hypothetical protein